LVLMSVLTAQRATAQPFVAPNRIDVSPTITTSGQPTAEMLSALGSLGYEAVIYLAPPTVSDAVANESQLVTRQGLTYVNLAIRFDAPTERDLAMFAALMSALSQSKVLVHCQVNFRASSMVFLYRTIYRKEDPHAAYQSVSSVWSPDGVWMRFIVERLRKHGIDFDPF
jgi:protein tyrosine phosphatase (PTP) superfamily phosphohydrolase (DUF442 family)